MRLPTLRPHSRHTRRLHSFVDGNLADADSGSIQRHLAGCERCQALHLELRGLRAALRALPAHEAPRSFRLTPTMAGAGAGSAQRSSSRQRVLPWVQNGSRAVGALAAAALAVLVVVDLGPGGGSTMSANDTASLAASAGGAAGGQASENANPAFAQDSAAAPEATETAPAYDSGEVTAQAAPGGAEPLPSPEPPSDGQVLTPEPDAQDILRSSETAAQKIAPPPDGESSNSLLRSAQIVLGAIAVIGIAASFLVPHSFRKAKL